MNTMHITKKVVGFGAAILGAFGVVAVIFFCVFGRDPLMPFVLMEKAWTAADFNAFLDHCNDKRLNALARSLKTDGASVADIKKEFLWQSSHLLTCFCCERGFRWLADRASHARMGDRGDAAS
jgi:hypothetical protein